MCRNSLAVMYPSSSFNFGISSASICWLRNSKISFWLCEKQENNLNKQFINWVWFTLRFFCQLFVWLLCSSRLDLDWKIQSCSLQCYWPRRLLELRRTRRHFQDTLMQFGIRGNLRFPLDIEWSITCTKPITKKKRIIVLVDKKSQQIYFLFVLSSIFNRVLLWRKKQY